MKDLRKRVVSGSIWNAGASLVRYGFDIAVNIVLARLLVPEDFGLVAMATVMSGLVAVLGRVGLGNALVQRKEIDESHRSSVFWVMVPLSLVLAGLTAASGPVVAWFYEEPALLVIMPVVAIQFPIGGLSTVPLARIQRDLRFKTLAQVNLAAIFISGTAAVATAALGGGVWSIVMRALLVQGVSMLAFVAVAKWRPRWTFRWAAIRDLLKFSVSYYFNQVVIYASRNLDTILIGRFLGSAPLGIYSRSYTLMMLPLQSVNTAVYKVLFAAFSSIQDDSARVRRIYLQYSGALAIFIFPAMLGLALVANPLVITVLGPEWAELGPILEIMAPAATWQGVMSIHQTLYLAKGRTDLQLRYTIIGRAFVIAGIVAGLRWGINGVAAGFVVGNFIHFAINVHVAGALVDLTWWRLLTHIRGVIGSALLMSVAVGIAARMPEVTSLPEWGQLLVLIPLGAVTYATCVLLFKPVPYGDLMGLASRFRNKRAG